MRDDFCTSFREQLVIASLIEMVMGIEQGIDLRIGREGFQGGKYLVGVIGRSAVDEDKAVCCRECHDVCATTIQDGDIVCLSTKQ